MRAIIIDWYEMSEGVEVEIDNLEEWIKEHGEGVHVKPPGTSIRNQKSDKWVIYVSDNGTFKTR